ncbi:leucyl/phenylalanyl-tRNA--protein transferase [Mucilaginibacter rubeus]|uniref:Leucyl/phenylalanyl-tRNA--protein transferase n=1 Tax=Mucilaginibacter rubeus TaxID=2027860 RepID=A0AAE6MKJ7_9SPHI|nr:MULTISPECIES: leucyl/phenylalanyl-tRNA--protein transferase [Mucilaginibacter]QEM06529.1 leucyl/phenylalanyl-tRNA--protein transferase [Mucilaginibacter rubeus]QEM19118.1 leucyl/phenylalanyl-tRNA--protein transferase [Mucilaginibacter gossypii]QTE44341.1 leucyl/phenylalanyl-tRNA--protein transferase [Mucilaginibacter rubeus]QTE50941.1 leucyl/phenylalanyl-tRNA--protein transferase [Mucilaginibacter rubeus]QTE56024.1 leucyl/phenylalanyl-tRNA--protein transferase [Mucilaginibacter rubeus]
MIFRLDERLIFPKPDLAEPDGLLAVGGDLSTDRLLLAYQNGIFPWYSDDTPILWYSPHERFVLFPDELKVSKSMRQVLRSGKLKVTVDTCFNDVITACSTAPREGQDGTWIVPDMITAYNRLHLEGYAHSVEVWQDDKLVGGLYGVHVGDVFCGESMFSRVSNASKTALIYLCNTGIYKLIDCQVHTGHLESLGARMISREQYMDVLLNNLV